jgi:maltooligosyltrehalose trehalohydrolase
MDNGDRPQLGAIAHGDHTRFTVWAPKARALDVLLTDHDEPLTMTKQAGGYFSLATPLARAGSKYRIRLDGKDAFPDPASRFQPDGVHGESEVVDASAFQWTDDAWEGHPLERMVVYELHVGTFTPEGTFAAATERLEYLCDLGVNTVELMPVADFPGERNWGYDHAALYAPSRAYGRPDDLRRFVDQAHKLGLAVILDVIYNHLGPDGAYAAAFAPFFTDKHHTPWGLAINLDDTHGEGVRHFFVDNALYWLREYHVDALRLDATHALIDDSPTHFLADLRAAVDALETGPRRLLIAEDHRNLNRLLVPVSEGGYGMDAVWADDIHHLLRNRIAGDVEAYYENYRDTTIAQIAKTINRGWYFDGTVKPVRKRDLGTDPAGLRPEQFVYCIQNHDQVGNRPLGNRLTDDVDLAAYRAVSSLLLFLPQTPLLFMGQEWAASTPFLFFTDHNAELGRAVTAGRRDEFKGFKGFSSEVPDPQALETFTRSRLDWSERDQEPHAGILRLYKDLLERRKELSGEVRAEPVSDEVLRIARGQHELYVAFEGGVSCPVGADAAAWHSQLPEYGATPEKAPSIGAGTLEFPDAAAVLIINSSGTQ